MDTHSYYRTSGILLSGPFKIAYEHGETIAFSQNYAGVLGFAPTCTWNLYNSSSGSLIKTFTGDGAQTSLTHTEGKQGVDVELLLTWGISLTRFYKRHRILVMPDCSSPTAVINITGGAGLTVSGSEGASVMYDLNLAAYSGGEIIELQGTLTCRRINITNAPNNTSNPVIFVIKTPVTITKHGDATDNPLIFITSGDPTNGIWIYGKKDSNGVRYLTLDGGGVETIQGSNINSHNNMKWSGIYCTNAKSSGLKPKNDLVTRAVGGFDDCWIFDCWVTDATNEGLYGNYFTYAYDTAGGFNNYHHAFKRCKFFANVVTDCGWDGIQLAGADDDAEVHDNLSLGNATADQSSQNFSYSINNGFKGMFYNNIGDTFMQIQPYGHTFIFNNYITAATGDYGIFVRRENNPGDGSPSYNLSDPAAELYIFNNLILSNKDSVYLLDVTPTAVPFAVFKYLNNALYISGTPVTGQLRLGSAVVPTTDNYQASVLSDLAITDKDNLDLSLASSSKVFLAANEGVDISDAIAITTFGLNPKLILSDITGQSSPLRGHFVSGVVQRYAGYMNPEPTKTMVQWYQTAQTSVFSDKEKIPDMFGATVKRYAYIGGSAKPRYLMAVKPWARTGTEEGIEYVDDASNL